LSGLSLNFHIFDRDNTGIWTQSKSSTIIMCMVNQVEQAIDRSFTILRQGIQIACSSVN
jgi:hypothetical protein